MGFGGSCETSTFGIEFVAMKQATEYVRGLRFKLRMMGITVDEPAYVFGDNQSVFANTSAPALTLKKKSNAIAYHFVREGCAKDEWRTAYINTHDNMTMSRIYLLSLFLQGRSERSSSVCYFITSDDGD
jgi:hypothetical protein